MMRFLVSLPLLYATCCAAVASAAPPQEASVFQSLSPHHNPPDLSIIAETDWKRIDASIDRGLAYLATQQERNGAIDTRDSGRPAVTALMVMAFLADGHRPGVGPYGGTIDRAIDFVLSTQRDDGLFTYLPATEPVTDWDAATHVATYNHGICGLMLGEVYGMTDPARAARIKPAIEKALRFVRGLQQMPVPESAAHDRGGWRYVEVVPYSGKYADVSVASWMIMFMRSAHNAGFDVPEQWVTEAVDYVERCFEKRSGGFLYSIGGDRRVTRGTTGAGVLSLFLTSRYNDELERGAGEWLISQRFDRFNAARIPHDRYYYACYYGSQAAYQLGGKYWAKVYPEIAFTMIDNQRSNGSWRASHFNTTFGPQYSTTMAILSLTPPYQLLPIYQR